MPQVDALMAVHQVFIAHGVQLDQESATALNDAFAETLGSYPSDGPNAVSWSDPALSSLFLTNAGIAAAAIAQRAQGQAPGRALIFQVIEETVIGVRPQVDDMITSGVIPFMCGMTLRLLRQ